MQNASNWEFADYHKLMSEVRGPLDYFELKSFICKLWVQPQDGKFVTSKEAFPWNFQGIAISFVNKFTLNNRFASTVALYYVQQLSLTSTPQMLVSKQSDFVLRLMLVCDKPLLIGHFPSPRRWPLNRRSTVLRRLTWKISRLVRRQGVKNSPSLVRSSSLHRRQFQ